MTRIFSLRTSLERHFNEMLWDRPHILTQSYSTFDADDDGDDMNWNAWKPQFNPFSGCEQTYKFEWTLFPSHRREGKKIG